MQNKAPQGKTDPIPTPEPELERYGVWVKAEPQDVLDEPTIDRETIIATPVDGSDAVLLSKEEEDILDSFDLPDEATDDVMPEFESASPAEPSDDLETFDFEDLEPLEMDAVSEPSLSNLDEDVIEDTVIDLPLDELEYEDHTTEPSSTELSPGTPSRETEPASGDTFQTTEISIDDFGLGDDEASSGGPSLESMGTVDADFATAPGEAGGAPADEFESLDIDLQFDDTIPSVETIETDNVSAGEGILDAGSEFETVDIDSIGLPEEPSGQAAVQASPPDAAEEPAGSGYEGISLDSFIDEDTDDSSGIIPDLEMERVSIGDEAAFDDVKAVTEDLGAASGEPSSDLLKQIATELSSIKEELVSLRGQLSSLKAAGATIPEPEPDVGLGPVGETAPGGFFDDEDDDTIALTGDELDNILNTADFTEEAADDESLEAPQLKAPADMDLLPENGDYASEPEQGIETIEPQVEEDAVEELIDIDALEGVTPLTSPPEDTSFLDEAAGDDIMELEGMPLEDVPLVEPNPSDLDIIVDSAFGNEDEELPIIETADEESEPEIILDIDADETPVVSTVDSFPEPIDEVEEAFELEELLEPEDLGGMELHSESSTDRLEALDDAKDAEPPTEEPAPTQFESTPVHYHPDELPTSLDDSLFVEPSGAAKPEIEPEIEPEPVPEEASPEEPVAVPPPLAAANPPEEPPEPSAEGPVPDKLKRDVKSVLVYLDQLLASLPEEKIEEFASSEYYDTYKRLFDDLGLL